jgi:hypothetical protein
MCGRATHAVMRAEPPLNRGYYAEQQVLYHQPRQRASHPAVTRQTAPFEADPRGDESGVFANLLHGCEPFHPHNASRTGGIRPRGSAHLLGGLEGERWGNGEAQRLGGLQINDQLEYSRLLDRQVGRLGPLGDLVDVGSRPPLDVRLARAIGHQAPGRYRVSPQAAKLFVSAPEGYSEGPRKAGLRERGRCGIVAMDPSVSRGYRWRERCMKHWRKTTMGHAQRLLRARIPVT